MKPQCEGALVLPLHVRFLIYRIVAMAERIDEKPDRKEAAVRSREYYGSKRASPAAAVEFFEKAIESSAIKNTPTADECRALLDKNPLEW